MDDLERLIESCKVSASMAVNALVRGGYEDLVAYREREHFTADQLDRIVGAYPDKLISPPAEAVWGLKVVPEPDSDPQVFHAAMRLWTEREGRSRLVMRFRFTESGFASAPWVVEREIVSLAIEDPTDRVQPWPPAS